MIDDEYITPDGISSIESSALGKKRYSIHWFRYRQIQSEIRTILYEKPLPIYSGANYTDWQTAMHQRIQQWYDAVLEESRDADPRTSGSTKPEMRQLTFRRALLFLYRPSPNIPVPSTQGMLELASSAASVIDLYRQFYRENKLLLFWQAIENLFDAGTALMYSYVNANPVRERVTLHVLENMIHSTSTVLWGLVERFPSLKGKRDAFDLIASKVFSELGAKGSQGGFATVSSDLGHLGGSYPNLEVQNASAAVRDDINRENELENSPGHVPTGKSSPTSTSNINQDHRTLEDDNLGSALTDNVGSSSFPGTEELSIDWESINGVSQLPSSMWEWEL